MTTHITKDCGCMLRYDRELGKMVHVSWCASCARAVQNQQFYRSCQW